MPGTHRDDILLLQRGRYHERMHNLIMANSFDLLEKKLVFHIQETKKRKKAAKKSKIEHYFAGQYDAFTQALLELKMLKYELDMPEDADDTVAEEEIQAVVEVQAVESEIVEQTEAGDDAAEARTGRKKTRKRRKAQPKELSPAILAAQDLLQRAVQAGVITQKISLYVHEDFPDGRLRGKTPVLELLTDEALAGKIAQQIAEKQAA